MVITQYLINLGRCKEAIKWYNERVKDAEEKLKENLRIASEIDNRYKRTRVNVFPDKNFTMPLAKKFSVVNKAMQTFGHLYMVPSDDLFSWI